MKKNIFLILAIAGGLFAACNKEGVESITLADVKGNADIYPSAPAKWFGGSTPKFTPAGFVGDVMPYYDNDSFHIFYLHDARDGATGFHPWSKFTTTDFTSYNYSGVQIPYGGTSDQDLALGTGSIVKAGDTYYAYYSGFNPNFTGVGGKYRDVILLATSKDLNHWTKVPGFIIKPETTNGYNQWEFRDPYVFFNQEKNEYWMLQGGQKDGKAVVMLYTTTDLATGNWQLKDPIYTNPSYSVPETPQLIKWGNYWYLIFSEQKENVTRYRMANSSDGPWTTPANDKLDGQYMYASKYASDGTNSYLFGWCATKSNRNDGGNRDFGGNLAVHQLTQNADGTIAVSVPANIDKIFIKETPLQLALKQQDVNVNANSISFPTSDGEAIVTFDRLVGEHKITATISGVQAGASFGLVFGMDKTAANSNYYKINFDESTNILSGLAINGDATKTDGAVNIDLEAGKEYQLKVIIDGSVCAVYIDNKVALTSRIYSLNNNFWGFFASKGALNVRDIKITGL